MAYADITWSSQIENANYLFSFHNDINYIFLWVLKKCLNRIRKNDFSEERVLDSGNGNWYMLGRTIVCQTGHFVSNHIFLCRTGRYYYACMRGSMSKTGGGGGGGGGIESEIENVWWTARSTEYGYLLVHVCVWCCVFRTIPMIVTAIMIKIMMK